MARLESIRESKSTISARITLNTSRQCQFSLSQLLRWQKTDQDLKNYLNKKIEKNDLFLLGVFFLYSCSRVSTKIESFLNIFPDILLGLNKLNKALKSAAISLEMENNH